MKLLFSIDTKDYDINAKGFVRHSARCISIKNSRVAMVYSQRYDYYKFPGGGINEGETQIDALIRETKEEAGLTVIPSSVKEFGYVHRIEKYGKDGFDYFLQDNFYYLCDVSDNEEKQSLDDYEADEGFTPVWVLPEIAIDVNRNHSHAHKSFNMIEREARVLEILIKDGYFDEKL